MLVCLPEYIFLKVDQVVPIVYFIYHIISDLQLPNLFFSALKLSLLNYHLFPVLYYSSQVSINVLLYCTSCWCTCQTIPYTNSKHFHISPIFVVSSH